MTSRLVAGMLAGTLILAAAVAARQQRGGRGAPGTPDTILSVVVEVGPSTVRVLSATAVRGVIRPVNQQALSNAPYGNDQALIEYTAASKSAPAGAAAFTSIFHVSYVPIVEAPPGEVPPGTPYKPGRPVTIAIALPDLPADTVVSFSRITPVPGTPPDTWTRTPIGQAQLPPVRR